MSIKQRKALKKRQKSYLELSREPLGVDSNGWPVIYSGAKPSDSIAGKCICTIINSGGIK